jgi:hypothetical protein
LGIYFYIDFRGDEWHCFSMVNDVYVNSTTSRPIQSEASLLQ